MSKPKKKLSNKEKLAKDRQRKKEKYEIIKNNPELYAMQKEKEHRRYLLRKEQQKICSIKDMTPRAQREQRKRWQVNSLKYLNKKKEIKKIETILLENSPPDSETENMIIEERANPLEIQNINEPLRRAKQQIRRLRYKHMKTVRLLKAEIFKLKKNLKTEIQQEAQKKQEKEQANKAIENSVEKRVNELMSDIQGEKIEEIKRKILFGECVSKNLKQEYRTLDKKNKRPFVEQIIKNRDQMKQYRLLGQVPFPCRKKVHKPVTQNKLKEKIRIFFEDDANSSLAAGKKEFIKSNGVKNQKRYLRDTIGNLHEKFCKDEIKIGYSTFCRYRPAWIVSPNTRNTCACKIHSNVDLLMESLKKAGITKEGSSSEILKSICCNANNEKCLNRECLQCANNTLNYQEFSNDVKIDYYEWITDKQSYKGKDGKEKTTKVTVKKKLEDYPRNIIKKLEESILPKFFNHAKNIALQYASIKQLKTDLKNDEILIHIDFSENYCLKYNSEIQSFHFGGSRGQVSLHTGVLYYIDSETNKITTKSFCTFSKCLQHDAASVWAHLIPVLDMAKKLVSSLKVIHFLSDSPTSQYRNKFIFYMMTKLKESVPDIQTVTWNYSEAGHGKGAPDGIGAVVKRTADNYVKHGGDVGSFENFVEVVSQSIRNIQIEIIEEEAILNRKFPQNIPTFKGTMNVHQAIWCLSLPHTVAFRKLSCFECSSSYIPCQHKKHLGVLSIGIDSKSTTTSKPKEVESLDLNTCNETIFNDGVSANLTTNGMTNEISGISITEPLVHPIFNDSTYDLNLDSPTIQNNISSIDDVALLNQIDDEVLLNDTIDNPKVTILSDVKIDWQNLKFRNKKSAVFHQSGQEEFKKFISDTVILDSDRSQNLIFNEDFKSKPEHKDKRSCDLELYIKKQTEKDDNKENNKNKHTQKDDNKENIKNKQTEKDDNKENMINKPNECQRQDYNIGDWVIVEYKIKSKVYAYVGKITENSNDTYAILFLKKTSTKSNTFSWPTVADEDTIPKSRIMCTLSKPVINRRGQYYFNSLPDLNYK